jgi:hypothetical protein
VFTGDKIPNCPTTKRGIHRLNRQEADYLLTSLDLPQEGTLSERRAVLVEAFC